MARNTAWKVRLRRLSRPRLIGLVVLLVLATLLAAPAAWLRISSAGDQYTISAAPRADVAIVFGAQLEPGGSRPKRFLAARLRATAQLVRTGRVRAVLVSGDGESSAGSETDAMRAYLVELGVDRALIVNDPYGLDTFDTCRRAHDVYGVRRALLVTQAYHLPRAVTLCRNLGIDVAGVDAGCTGCRRTTLAKAWLRELPAGWKAVLDSLRGRQPAVVSPPDPALSAASRR
jgi:vancomycin permeability regulator SanA